MSEIISKIQKNSSSRSAQRLSLTERIKNSGLSSNPFCRRCTRKNFICVYIKNDRCSKYVQSDVEGSYNAIIATRTDKILKE